MAGLVLEPVEVAGPTRWRWLLRTEDGEPLATHQVAVPEGDFEYGGFTDLYRWLRWQADPQRRVTSEAELTARVGGWIGQHLLGAEVMEVLLDEAPVAVRMPVPAQLGFLPYRPWELATWQGQVLGREEVGFVFDLPDTRRRPRTGRQATEALRVLALFSLPTGETPLGLRRERHALQRLIRGIGQGQSPRAVQLRVLQYGVTRDALEKAVDDQDGWDVLHVSGHAAAGTLVLECEDGTPDPIDAPELAELLSPMRRRLRLAVLAGCETGAATAADTLRLLDLTAQAEPLEEQARQEADSAAAATSGSGGGAAPAAGWSGLGRALVARLGCAVLAMRYPVIDDFAIDLSERLYRGIFQDGQPLDVALARALPRVASTPPSLGAPAVSLATPALLGPATGLTLQPPSGRAAPISVALAGFPNEPPRFVGRTRTLTAARRALLPDSGRSGVLLHGMAGAGKTTAAVELTYQTAAGFTAAAWWTAPPADLWPTALNSLANTLEARLNPNLAGYGLSVQLVGNTATDTLLDNYLPVFTELMKQVRLLLVLDNLETLLTDGGDWKDPRFGRVVAALTGHAGASRVVLTSRTTPTGLDPERVDVLPVHALSRDEALLLARELPHLRALTHDTEPATRTTSPQVTADRALLARTLTVVQGHPKLLELADATAADPQVLEQRVAAAETAAANRGTPLAAFLETGHSEADPGQLLAALTGWTRAAAGALPEPSRLLLQLLAAAEPDDRTSTILAANWADLWHRLARPGDPPPWPDTLAPLVGAALVEPEPVGDPGDPDRPVRYRLHPGVADTIRTDTPAEVRTAADTELAAYWNTTFQIAREQEHQQATGWLVVHAALAAAPYLLRLHNWQVASSQLEHALRRDGSPGTVAAALPHLQAIAEATTGTDRELIDRSVLVGAVAQIDPAEGERWLRTVLEAADDRGQHLVAIATVGALANLLRDRGRYREALAIVDRMAELTRRAGLGPWTQLAVDGQRLQLLSLTGDPQAVFDEVQQLRNRMHQLPDQPGNNENVNPFNVRETILDTGRTAAQNLARWQEALDLNAEQLDSKRQRGAGPYELAYTAFNDYGPLIRLGRLPAVDRLLQECQDPFEEADDTRMLGKVLSARADLADEQGHPEAAIRLAEIALRYSYAARDTDGIAVRHFNLAYFQQRAGRAAGVWLAHRLTSTLLDRLNGDRRLQDDLRSLARDLTDSATAADLPATVGQIRTAVEKVEGVHLGDLLNTLQPNRDQHQAALDEIIYSARTLAPDQAFDVQRHLGWWEPVLAAVAAATGGNQAAQEEVTKFLDDFPDDSDWAALVQVLRRILAGERDPDILLPDLDPADTAIVTRLLDALAGRVHLQPPSTQPALSTEDPIDQWEPVLAAIAAASGGDQTARQEVTGYLDGLADDSAWAALAGVLRRVLDGERDPQALLAGLDTVDTTIVTRLLDALAGRIQLNTGSDFVASTDELVGQWEPALAAIVAASGGDQTARQEVTEFLDDFDEGSDWAALAGVLRRVLAGERDPEVLLDGLDAVDTAIAARLLDALAGRIQLNTGSDVPEAEDGPRP
ncbi:CHAT domain-containing protein [Geodermatophilus siccatus]|uniref:CHAT domain-containing protein n=1 Tax=Geodermatophilus siccatus TaxID=1137991 RepID=A0A1G9KJ35_9ACTN|nr:AAA family ATPase [Geodermatophilus siccatus]SDL49850.1 CHAT domain-containing protein [Geodermatophilus siccatus]